MYNFKRHINWLIHLYIWVGHLSTILATATLAMFIRRNWFLPFFFLLFSSPEFFTHSSIFHHCNHTAVANLSFIYIIFNRCGWIIYLNFDISLIKIFISDVCYNVSMSMSLIQRFQAEQHKTCFIQQEIISVIYNYLVVIMKDAVNDSAQ